MPKFSARMGLVTTTSAATTERRAHFCAGLRRGATRGSGQARTMPAPRFSERLSLFQTHYLHLTATFLAPSPNHPAPLDDQDAVGFDGDFGSSVGRHFMAQALCPTAKSC